MARNVFWTIFSYVFCGGLAISTSILVPRLLGPDEFGIYSYVLWLAGWVAIFTQLSLPEGVKKFASNYWAVHDLRSLQKLVTGLAVIQATLSVVFCLCAVLLPVKVLAENMRILLFLALLGGAPSAVAAIYASAVTAMEEAHYITKIISVIGAMTVLVNVTVLLCGGRAIALLSTTLTFNFIYFLLIWKTFESRTKAHSSLCNTDSEVAKIELKPIVKYCFGITAASILSTFCMDKGEIFFLRLYSGTEAIGLYALAFNLSQKIMLIPSSMNNILVPMFAKFCALDDEEKKLKLYHDTQVFYAFTLIPICFILASSCSLLVPFLYSQSFSAASLATAMAFLAIPSAIFTVPALSLIYGSTGMTKRLISLMLVPLSVDLIACAVLVPPYGVNGAATANLLTQWSMAGLLTWHVRKTHRVTSPRAALIKISFCSTLSASFSYLASRYTVPQNALFVIFAAGLICLLLYRVAGLFDHVFKIFRPSQSLPKRLKTRVEFLEKCLTRDKDQMQFNANPLNLKDVDQQVSPVEV